MFVRYNGEVYHIDDASATMRKISHKNSLMMRLFEQEQELIHIKDPYVKSMKAREIENAKTKVAHEVIIDFPNFIETNVNPKDPESPSAFK